MSRVNRLAVRVFVVSSVAALVSMAGVASAQEDGMVFDTPGAHTYVVPEGACGVEVAAFGASGGTAVNGDGDWGEEYVPALGGAGGGAGGTFVLDPGTTLDINVGGRGANTAMDGLGAAGGSNGGGDGGNAEEGEDLEGGAGGGGASDVTVAGDLLVVGGGGGGGASNNENGTGGVAGAGQGGAGGGAPGGSPDGNGAQGFGAGNDEGQNPGGGAGTVDGPGAGGVTNNAAADGFDGVGPQGGAGGNSDTFSFTGAGGGGGGGYFGGGGGGANNPNGQNNGNGGGGGGASFVADSATGAGFNPGVNPDADGAVVITALTGDACDDSGDEQPAEVVRAAPRFTG